MGKKKVSIITIIDAINVGSYLQAYALSHVVESNKCVCEIVDYRRRRNALRTVLKRSFKNMALFKALLYFAYWCYVTIRQRPKLLGFLKKHIAVTERKYHSYEELCAYTPVADIYITGSDQVWNSGYNDGVDEAFYLSYVPVGKRKIAYAASIGNNEFAELERRHISSLLASFDYISVREDSAFYALKDIGITNVDHVLDPTLLINKEKWDMVSSTAKFKKTEPYLLVYCVESNKKKFVGDYANRVAKRLNLKIYVISASGLASMTGKYDRKFVMISPEIFIKLFLNADYIVVSSFHGTAFSINFSKQFTTIAPEKYDTRVRSLLNLFNLERRLYLPSNESEYEIDIDYVKVSSILSDKREESLKYVNRILQ